MTGRTDDTRPWWQRYWGMPEESVPVSERPTQIDGYCRYCQWQGSLQIKHIHTVLCPQCDMPVDYKVKPDALDATPPVEPKPIECGKVHYRHAYIVCTRPTGHVGYHTDSKNRYSWSADAVPADQAPYSNLQQVRASVGVMTRCGLETKDGYCTRPRGHIGKCYPFAHLVEQRQVTGPPSPSQTPEIRGPVERAGAGMITATLKDGTLVAVEFKHEYKTVVGKRHVDATNNVAFRRKSKVLKGTEAKLFRLEERKDEDKPGVVQLVKALLNTAYVMPHPNDLHKGLAGGRRAALGRLLCDHDVDLQLQRCKKCHINRQAISPICGEPLSREDRKAVWEAYWDATASVRKLKCGCFTYATVPGAFKVVPCKEHTEAEKTEAA